MLPFQFVFSTVALNNENLYNNLNYDFKNVPLTPKFIINHINFFNDKKLDLNNFDIEKTIKFIIDNKSYKKNLFIAKEFQCYVELYFAKMYSKTKDYKYYNNFIKTITETNVIDKFNLDLESFFIKFEDKYLNI